MKKTDNDKKYSNKEFNEVINSKKKKKKQKQKRKEKEEKEEKEREREKEKEREREKEKEREREKETKKQKRKRKEKEEKEEKEREREKEKEREREKEKEREREKETKKQKDISKEKSKKNLNRIFFKKSYSLTSKPNVDKNSFSKFNDADLSEVLNILTEGEKEKEKVNKKERGLNLNKSIKKLAKNINFTHEKPNDKGDTNDSKMNAEKNLEDYITKIINVKMEEFMNKTLNKIETAINKNLENLNDKLIRNIEEGALIKYNTNIEEIAKIMYGEYEHCKKEKKNLDKFKLIEQSEKFEKEENKRIALFLSHLTDNTYDGEKQGDYWCINVDNKIHLFYSIAIPIEKDFQTVKIKLNEMNLFISDFIPQNHPCFVFPNSIMKSGIYMSNKNITYMESFLKCCNTKIIKNYNIEISNNFTICFNEYLYIIEKGENINYEFQWIINAETKTKTKLKTNECEELNKFKEKILLIRNETMYNKKEEKIEPLIAFTFLGLKKEKNEESITWYFSDSIVLNYSDQNKEKKNVKK